MADRELLTDIAGCPTVVGIFVAVSPASPPNGTAAGDPCGVLARLRRCPTGVLLTDRGRPAESLDSATDGTAVWVFVEFPGWQWASCRFRWMVRRTEPLRSASWVVEAGYGFPLMSPCVPTNGTIAGLHVDFVTYREPLSIGERDYRGVLAGFLRYSLEFSAGPTNSLGLLWGFPGGT